MLDSALRPLKDRVLAPVADLLAPRAAPIGITLLGFAAGMACVLMVTRGQMWAALALWVLNRCLDGLDGLVARRAGRQTDLGGYLDILLDFIVYAAIPIALGATRPVAAGLALAMLLAAFYVNAASWMYLSALLEKRAAGTAARGERTSVTMPVGIVEGTETIAFFTAFILFPHLMVTLFWTMTALLGATVLQRLAWANRHLRGPAPEAGTS